MKSTFASDISASKDQTGALIKLDWICPHCNYRNPDFFFSASLTELTSTFEVDRDCDYCGKKVTVICRDVSYDGL